MNLFDEIVGGRGNPLQQMEQSFGLDQETVGSVIKQFLPALTNGMKKNVSQEDGLQGLLGALSGGGHDRYLEGATSLSQQESVQDGNGILGHLLGSKDVSRQLASRTSEKTGVDSAILKKMLPLVAGLVMGALNKRLSSQSASKWFRTGRSARLLARRVARLHELDKLDDGNADAAAGRRRRELADRRSAGSCQGLSPLTPS